MTKFILNKEKILIFLVFSTFFLFINTIHAWNFEIDGEFNFEKQPDPIIINNNITYESGTSDTNCSVDGSCPDVFYDSEFHVTNSSYITEDTVGNNATFVGTNYSTNINTSNIGSYGYFNSSTWNNDWNASTGGSYPTKLNLTSDAVNADFNNGSHEGYIAGNAYCQGNFSGSHLCNEFEVQQWYLQSANGGYIDNDDAWIIAGSPKYAPATLPVSDCNGFTHGVAGSYLGNYWHFENTTGGDGRCINCGTTLKLACCSS